MKSNKNKTETITIRISPDVKTKLFEYSKEKDISVSLILRELICNKLKK